MQAVNKAVKDVTALWTIVDKHLADKPYMTGNEPTMGDIPLGISAYRWYTMDVERPDLKNMQAWYQRISERPAFRKHAMLPLK